MYLETDIRKAAKVSQELARKLPGVPRCFHVNGLPTAGLIKALKTLELHKVRGRYFAKVPNEYNLDSFFRSSETYLLSLFICLEYVTDKVKNEDGESVYRIDESIVKIINYLKSK